jgi:hypothetical protein
MRLIINDAFYDYHRSDEARKLRESIKEDFLKQGGTKIQFDMWLTTMRYEMADQIGFDPSEIDNNEFLTVLIVIQHSFDLNGKEKSTDGKEE